MYYKKDFVTGVTYAPAPVFHWLNNHVIFSDPTKPCPNLFVGKRTCLLAIQQVITEQFVDKRQIGVSVCIALLMHG